MKTRFTILLLSLLVFSGRRLTAQIGPVSFSPDGLENLTKNIGHASGIRPSPDGKTAMFLKWDLENNTNQLYKLDLATREVTLFPLTGIK